MDIQQNLDTCEKKLEEIRSHLHHPWLKGEMIKSNKKFNQILVSLDVLAECYLSVKEYCKIPEINGYSGGYLYLTGLLQSLYITTDCIKILAANIDLSLPDFTLNHTALLQLIEIRNDVIGHPTWRRSKKTMHYIDRSSITKDKFQYVTYFENSWDVKIKKINIKETLLYSLHESADLLSMIFTEMERKIETHFNTFKRMKLTPALNHIGYNIEKLVLGYSTNYALTDLNLNELIASFHKSLEEVKKIYPTLEMLPGLYHCADDISYMLNRLKGWLHEEAFHKNRDVLVFIDALTTKLEEYRSMLAEIEKTL